MPQRKIKLGDKIEDVTCMVEGIAIGEVNYLDGSRAWLMQPAYSEDGTRIPIVEVQDAYARRIGDGVYVEPKPIVGFQAREVG